MARKKLLIGKVEQKFMQDYLNNPSPVGYESEGQKIWLKYIKQYTDTHIVDNYGSVAAIINPKAKFKVVIEAHADEISWAVHYITKEGFIHPMRVGGSDHQIAPSKRVNIHTESGVIKAIFGWPAIHTRKTKEEIPALKNIFLDIGAASKQEVLDMGIKVGDPITYEDELTMLNDKFYVGRALDNRMGGFMIAQVARLLKESKKKLPFALYIVNAVQEEVGLRGAHMMAERIKPDVAIITDVTHDTHTPMINKIVEGDVKCGLGPSLTVGPAVHRKLYKLIEGVAATNKINIQREVVSRGTGTDTDSFAYSNGGVPSALISLPLRYMHTTVESAAKEDIEAVINLIYQSLLKITPKTNFKYL
ncbi:MAG: putative aminopeptidase FrvX [Limisphaerales bacterium]|jgi:putative aminopeptidase FrvX